MEILEGLKGLKGQKNLKTQFNIISNKLVCLTSLNFFTVV